MSATSGKQADGLGRRLPRMFFFFLGPAQLGARNEPPPDPNRPVPDQDCSLYCGHPTAAHTIVRVDGRSHMRCPRWTELLAPAHRAGAGRPARRPRRRPPRSRPHEGGRPRQLAGEQARSASTMYVSGLIVRQRLQPAGAGVDRQQHAGQQQHREQEASAARSRRSSPGPAASASA